MPNARPRLIAFALSLIVGISCIQLAPAISDAVADGSVDDPVMLLGNGTDAQNTLLFTTKATQVPTYFDLNTNRFQKPSVRMDVRAYHYSNNAQGHGSWGGFDSWTSILEVEYSWDENNVRTASGPPRQAISGMTAVSSGGSLSVKEVDPFEGFYVVAFSAKSPPVSHQSPNGCFLIEIEVSVKENGIDSSEQKFYFGANLRYQSQGGQDIPLPGPDEIVEGLAVNICLYGTDGSLIDPAEPITIRHREDVGPFQARVLLLDSHGDHLDPSDDRYDAYIYYASDLPDGLNMRSDGTIAGKLAGYVGTSSLQFTIYAVNGDYTTDRVS